MTASIHVTLVDDDAFMRRLLHRCLEAAGISVASFASGAELLGQEDLAATNVLLLDVKMPGMSGLELQDTLKQRGVDLPIVFISGASDLAVAVTAMRNGASDFIEKPFDADTLVTRVTQAVTRHAHRTTTPQPSANPLALARLQALTPRERQVFELLVTGMSSKLIARELGGSFRTIQIHRANVMRKLSARNLPELLRMGF